MYIRNWSLGVGRGITTAKRAIVAAAGATTTTTTILDYRLFGTRVGCSTGRVEGVDANVRHRRRHGFSSVRVSRSVRDARRPSVIRCALVPSARCPRRARAGVRFSAALVSTPCARALHRHADQYDRLARRRAVLRGQSAQGRPGPGLRHGHRHAQIPGGEAHATAVAVERRVSLIAPPTPSFVRPPFSTPPSPSPSGKPVPESSPGRVRLSSRSPARPVPTADTSKQTISRFRATKIVLRPDFGKQTTGFFERVLLFFFFFFCKRM